jgi:hypothetical protein
LLSRPRATKAEEEKENGKLTEAEEEIFFFKKKFAQDFPETEWRRTYQYNTW